MFDPTMTGASGEGGGSATLPSLRDRLRTPSSIEAALLADYEQVVADQRRLAVRELDLLAEIDELDAATTQTGHHTVGHVAEVSGCSMSNARRRVRSAQRLTQPRWDPLATALQTGRVGPNHADVLLRAANPRIEAGICELLPELLDLAEVATFERFAREVRGIAERLDQDGGYDPDRDPDRNRLTTRTGPDGSLHLEIDLVDELALMVRAVIDAATERVRDRYRADRTAAVNAEGEGDQCGLPIPSLARCGAEAIAELLQRGAGVPDDQEVLLHPEAIVVLHPTDGQDLLDADITDILGNPLPRPLTRFVLAAGAALPFEFSDTVDPLRVGTTLRYANRQQRRALAIRDGGCVFPGCTRKPEQTDAHHVAHWHQHNGRCPPDCDQECGPTDIENLVLLCRHHHRVTHRPGWHMEGCENPLAPAEVRFRWITPSGRALYSQRHEVKPEPRPMQVRPPSPPHIESAS